ncbi:uncharacterized protein LOC122274584 [Carya illinoinensis]|uniref:uncharacterized protein LOC122274584 n=1 Tax=Carya illinoinensis TaxID=32201 RepID=UPI001C71984C|nr:uncharacterized protein LOC122274584 [Carya illinoinensis]
MATDEKGWESIWKLNIHGVVKQFLWKVCHELLPTRLNLFKKHIINNNMCPVCEREVETTIHALWCCPVASDVWEEHDSPVQKWAITDIDFMELWKKLHLSLEEEEIELVACTLRGIWLRRNALIFEKKFNNPRRVLSIAKQGRDEFTTVKVQTLRSSSDRREAMWQRPTNMVSKVKWDIAALNEKKKKVGIGVIARNSEGDILTCLCLNIQAAVKPILAEALALRRALFFSHELGLSNVLFEGDSQTIVKKSNSREEILADYGVVVDDIRTMLRDRPHWSVQFTYRKANNTTHILAKLGLTCKDENVWMEEGSIQIMNSVMREKYCNSFE